MSTARQLRSLRHVVGTPWGMAVQATSPSVLCVMLTQPGTPSVSAPASSSTTSSSTSDSFESTSESTGWGSSACGGAASRENTRGTTSDRIVVPLTAQSTFQRSCWRPG